MQVSITEGSISALAHRYKIYDYIYLFLNKIIDPACIFFFFLIYSPILVYNQHYVAQDKSSCLRVVEKSIVVATCISREMR